MSNDNKNLIEDAFSTDLPSLVRFVLMFTVICTCVVLLLAIDNGVTKENAEE